MTLKNTTTRYGSIAKFLHWLIFILLLCMVILGFYLESIPKAYQGLTYNTHKLTGLTILILMLVRAVWASMNIKPSLPYATQFWERVAERSVHLLLYAVVITMPIVGWIGASAGGKPPHLGSFNLLLPVTQSKELSKKAFFIHNSLAIFLIVLISVHVLAALYHHFLKRDDVLKRMMPNN